MKKLFSVALLSLGFASMAQAETKLPQWINDVKLSGYVMTQYQYSDQENAKANSFNLRLGRIALEGRIQQDWYWKVQLQFNGNTSTLGNSPRVVDAFTEWQKYSFFKVKVGQFKRAFTFENPMHPIDQGFFSYAQAINKLCYFSDRSGVKASNGRDIGVQVQGDFLPNAQKHDLLHYQIGVYNGQGINTKDVDQQKDVIGGIWVMPVAGMRLGVFGSEGSYARKGDWTDESGAHKGEVRKLPQHRYAFSAEYKASDWTFRSEYVHSTGKAFKVSESGGNGTTDCTVNEAIGSKADAYYALVIAPVISKKLYTKARYDLYRQSAEWGSSRTQYEAGLNYLFNKNIQLNTEYMCVNDRNLDKPNYNMIDVQLDFRF